MSLINISEEFAKKHSGKLALSIFIILFLFSLGMMGPYWRNQIIKYNQFMSTPGAAPISLSMPASPQMLERGKNLFLNNCSSCHGTNAQGQSPTKPLGGLYPDGQYYAPALDITGHAAVHNTKALFFVIKHGSLTKAESAMRGWEGRMSDEDMVSIVQWFRSTWPASLQEAQGKYYDTCFP